MPGRTWFKGLVVSRTGNMVDVRAHNTGVVVTLDLDDDDRITFKGNHTRKR